jgi:hypothetical protein
MTALPIEGYAREFTDAAAMRAAYAARQRRLAALSASAPKEPEPVKAAPVFSFPQPTKRPVPALARSGLIWTDEESEALLEMARAGRTSLAIAKHLRRSKEAVKKRARQMGCVITGRPRTPPALDTASIKLLYRLTYERPNPGVRAQVNFIIEETARQHGLSVNDVTGEGRSLPIVRARQQAVWICARDTPLSLAAIGRLFQRDHTTIMAAVRRQNERCGANVRGLGGPK